MKVGFDLVCVIIFMLTYGTKIIISKTQIPQQPMNKSIIIFCLAYGENEGWVEYLGDNNEEFHDIPLEWEAGSRVKSLPFSPTQKEREY